MIPTYGTCALNWIFKRFSLSLSRTLLFVIDPLMIHMYGVDLVSSGWSAEGQGIAFTPRMVA